MNTESYFADGTDRISKYFGLVWTVVLVLLTVLPYLVNAVMTPAGWIYTWILPPYPDDSLAYQAWSRQALNGHFLFQLKYTATPHAACVFQPLFLVSGWLAHLTGAAIGVVHLAVKSVGVVFFAVAFLRLMDVLRLTRSESVLSTILVTFSSGVGAWLALLSPGQVEWLKPADLWLVDLNTYWSLLWNPLYPYSLALLLVAIRFGIEWRERGELTRACGAGISTGLLALIHPYQIPILFGFFLIALITAHADWSKRLRGAALFFGLSLPPTIYLLVASRVHPILVEHALAGRMDSPSLVSLALGLGLLLIPAAVGLAASKRRREIRIVAIWFIVAIALAYFPSWFQRKYLFGIHLPLCILAAIGLCRLVKPVFIRGLLIAPCLITPVYLVIGNVQASRDSSPGSAYFMSDEFRDALDNLRSRTNPDDIVFASYPVSRLIPAISGNTVLWGHWAQSVDLEQKRKLFAQLFGIQSTLSAAERAALFRRENIDYMLIDASFMTWLGGEFPDWLDKETRTIWSNGSSQIRSCRPDVSSVPDQRAGGR